MVDTIPNNWTKLQADFYQRDDVVAIARQLLGKIIVSMADGVLSAARIVETEAYNGVVDRASHAYNNRRTPRTEVMYAAGGVAYVYLCYGIHRLFNVVTHVADTPHAVLIRAAQPVVGEAIMMERTSKKKWGYDITRGPGNVSKALGIGLQHTGMSLLGDLLWLADDGCRPELADIVAGARIGVDYAGEDSQLSYRFWIRGSRWVSGRKVGNG